MGRTQIEWVVNPDGSQGYTWNPITGCLNHINGLCKGGGFPCYAYKLADGRLKGRYLANKNIACGFDRDPRCISENNRCWHDPFYPRFWEEKLLKAAKGLSGYLRTKSKGIFVCDMSDLFGIGIPEEWTKRVLWQCKIFSQHRFYLLTKQPQNLIKWSPFPENCWVGVTATNGRMVDDAGYYLERIEAKVKFLSLEPLLEPMLLYFGKPSLDWLIIGQQTPVSAKTQPKIEWIKEIVEAADRAGVKVFLKDNLRSLIEWPRDHWAFDNLSNIIRQEMPK
jgi:protein gp37